MESLQSIKSRMESIISTRQITQSMGMVSTIKSQRVRGKMVGNRPFTQEAERLMRIAGDCFRQSSHPFMQKRDAGCAAVIVISGDRGLCGGYNINVGKETSALIKSVGDAKIITVGDKAGEYCRRRFKSMVAHSFRGISENPFYDDAVEIASMTLDWYTRGGVDQVYVVHTQFENMLSQKSRAVKLLPVDASAERRSGVIRCDSESEAFFSNIVHFYVTAFVYGAILESSVCEQSARITSMDNAVRNADDMIDSLALSYNQARQWTITQELIEIVGGADAVTKA